MSVLPDWRIHILCQSGAITPFDAKFVNPASLDIRLGENIFEEHEEVGLVANNIGKHTREDPYKLYPNEFILAESMELFNIPNNISCQFALKSSMARMGLEHSMAGWIDPGFNDSVLTLELKNALRLGCINIWPGMRIGQLIFFSMQGSPVHNYRETGRYNGDKRVTKSKGTL